MVDQAAVPGESAVSARSTAHPKTAVAAIGAGLRLLHDTLPVDTCPFSWSNEFRVADARRRAVEGRIDPASWRRSIRILLWRKQSSAPMHRPPSTGWLFATATPARRTR
jgi:aminoglycoside phosphotransferase